MIKFLLRLIAALKMKHVGQEGAHLGRDVVGAYLGAKGAIKERQSRPELAAAPSC